MTEGFRVKVSRKYRAILDVYLEWEGVTTPATGTFQEATKPVTRISDAENGLSAAEALCIWESRGKPSSVIPEEAALLARYVQGKSQRDWWTKEIGWWNKNSVYSPEEFLRFLGPLPFIDLFGRGPIPRLVRYYYDNGYALWEFRLDGLMVRMASKWKMSYYERDERESALRNAWRVMRTKWLEPYLYRWKKRLVADRGAM
jgi:hypothetical protein